MTSTWAKPASPSIRRYSSIKIAPAMQPTYAIRSLPISGGNSRFRAMSLTASRLSGFRTWAISGMTGVFLAISRLLNPGSRLAVSDIALKRELPPEIGSDLMAYVGCIAGAILIEEYRRMLGEAGFAHVEVIDSGRDLNAYAKVENQAGCCSPLPAVASLPITDTGCCSPNASTFEDRKSTRL